MELRMNNSNQFSRWIDFNCFSNVLSSDVKPVHYYYYYYYYYYTAAGDCLLSATSDCSGCQTSGDTEQPSAVVEENWDDDVLDINTEISPFGNWFCSHLQRSCLSLMPLNFFPDFQDLECLCKQTRSLKVFDSKFLLQNRTVFSVRSFSYEKKPMSFS